MEDMNRKKLIQKYYSDRAKDYDWQKARTWQSDRGFADEIIDEITDSLNNFEGKHVLEVGVGSGRNAAILLGKTRSRFVGLDLSGEMLELAKRKMNSRTEYLDLVLGDGENLPLVERSFDAIVCMSTMHYFARQEKVLKRFSKILKGGGVLVYGDLTLHESDQSGFFNNMERKLSKVHAGYYRPSEIKHTLEQCGFHVDKSRTITYKKSYRALMEDKGKYFGVNDKTFSTFLQEAEENQRLQYGLANEGMSLFYTIITATLKTGLV